MPRMGTATASVPPSEEDLPKGQRGEEDQDNSGTESANETESNTNELTV